MCEARSQPQCRALAVRFRFVKKRLPDGDFELLYLAHPVIQLEVDLPASKENTPEPEPEQVIAEVDVDYLRSLDPKEWKKQDHYKVLGIEKLRHAANEDTIKTAYRKIVLKHHPDKRKALGEDIQPDDDYYTCITMAYDILGNPTKRRSYDSVDPEFDDGLPSNSEVKRDFYKSFKKYFDWNARWSEKRRVPKLGDEEASRQDVEKFYSFWYDFKSWREYSYEDEEERDKCSDRDERRYVDKINKAERLRKKKEEMLRIRQLVDMAYNSDPRIAKFKQEDKDRKLAAKRAKQSAVQAKKEEEERVLREAQAAKERAEAAERAKIEAKRQEREAQKKAIKKERKAFRELCKSNENYAANPDDNLRHLTAIERICEALNALELEELTKNVRNNGKSAFMKAVKESEERVEAEKRASLETYQHKISQQVKNNVVKLNPEWTVENIQLLVKAVNLFPAGTNQRWDVVANFINQHGTFSENCAKFNAKLVLAKAKDMQNTDFSKNNMKEAANKEAFDNFIKEKRSDVTIKDSEMSTNVHAMTNGVSKEKPMQNGNAKPAKETNTKEVKESKETKENLAKETNGKEVTAKESKENATAWTTTEQQLLEQALKTYPASTPERWERIADCIPARSKKDCMRRYKELVETIKAKKAAQATVTFSSTFEERCQFTRDYNHIKKELGNIDDYDKTCIESAFKGISQIVLEEWGSNTLCQILLVTDGNTGVGPGSLRDSLNRYHQGGSFPLPFAFPAKLHVVCVCPPNEPSLTRAKPQYQKLIELCGGEGSVLAPEQVTEAGVTTIFQKLGDDIYTCFKGTLKCGHLESSIYLSPIPIPYIKVDDFEKKTYTISKTIEVVGFIAVADIGSPAGVSRHLILPTAAGNTNTNTNAITNNPSPSTSKIETDTSEENLEDDKQPCFCVLFHGALKVENMAALVSVAEDWFGFIYSWADSKKKSNLMLTVLTPGADAVPWLGDLNNLHCAEGVNQDILMSFPVRSAEKRSYSQNSVVWIRQTGLQSDIQKILRHAKKLPEKTQQFYKELNRLRKAALQLGFIELLEGLARIFEQEVGTLAPNAHADIATQLTHAAAQLHKTRIGDTKLIMPLQTTYNT